MAHRSRSIAVLCTYLPRPGREGDLLALLRAHWPALRSVGLVTAKPATVLPATNRRGRAVFVERFEWKDEGSAERAHTTPEILALWEPMERLCEHLDFLEFRPLHEERKVERKGIPARGRSRVGRKRPLAR